MGQKCCPACGEANQSEAAFCAKCGQQFSMASVTESPRQNGPMGASKQFTNQLSAQKNLKKKWNAESLDPNVRLVARGRDGRFLLFDNRLRIERVNDNREIPIDQIIDVYYNESLLVGGLAVSYIEKGVKKGYGISYNPTYQFEMKAMKTRIEQKMFEARIASQTQHLNSIDTVGQIERLGKLKEQGLLTEQEFQAKKQELLSRI